MSQASELSSQELRWGQDKISQGLVFHLKAGSNKTFTVTGRDGDNSPKEDSVCLVGRPQETPTHVVYKIRSRMELQLKSNQSSEALIPGSGVTPIPMRCLDSGRHFPDSREVTCREDDPGSHGGNSPLRHNKYTQRD